MITPTPEELARFMRKVYIRDDGCWEWIGAKSRGKGNTAWYGTFFFRGKSIRAHRFACDILGGAGPLPPGHDRSHTCDFSLCVCPIHLEHRPAQYNNDKRWGREWSEQEDWPSGNPYDNSCQPAY